MEREEWTGNAHQIHIYHPNWVGGGEAAIYEIKTALTSLRYARPKDHNVSWSCHQEWVQPLTTKYRVHTCTAQHRLICKYDLKGIWSWLRRVIHGSRNFGNYDMDRPRRVTNTAIFTMATFFISKMYVNHHHIYGLGSNFVFQQIHFSKNAAWFRKGWCAKSRETQWKDLLFWRHYDLSDALAHHGKEIFEITNDNRE